VTLSYAPADGSGHTGTPCRSTWKTRTGTAPAIPPRPGDYPLSAECKVCGGRIVLRHAVQLEWRHQPPAAVARCDRPQRLRGATVRSGQVALR
jgi:hypothetical protein